MINFPSVQKSVQAELDRVVGRDRTPSLADAKNTPYTEAVTCEIQGGNEIGLKNLQKFLIGGKKLKRNQSKNRTKMAQVPNVNYIDTQRHATIVPFGVNHAPMEDTTFAGYTFLR